MWLKKFRQRKGQTCIIFLMLAACTLLMAGSLGIFTSLIEPYNDFVKDTDAPSVRAIMYDNQIGTEEETVKRFEKLNEVERVIPLVRHIVEEKISYNDQVVNETIALVGYKEEAFEKIRMIDGKNQTPGEQECIMPYALAKLFDMQIGDQITFGTEEEAYSYTIAGLYTAPYSCNILYQSEVLVSHIPDFVSQIITYAVYGKEGVAGQDIVDAYVIANNGIMDGRFDTIEDVVGNITINEKILGGVLLALSIIVFLVCVLMIRFLLKNALIGDKKTIAIYKTIGYQERDILAMYMKFYMSIAVLGTLVGAIASPIIATNFIKQAFENIGLKSATISWWPRIIVMLGIVLLIALQVYLGVHKWKKIKPVIVLMDRESNLGVKKKRYLSLARGVDFSPFGMAVRMMQRNTKSTVYIIITCFLSIYMVNFAIVSYSNIKTMSENNYYWLGFDDHDISLITLNSEMFEESCDSISKLSDVEKLIKNSFEVRASIKWQKGIVNPNIVGMVYETYEGLNMTVVEGRNPRYSNEVVIGNLLATELNKKVGDYIDLYFGTDKKVSLLIVGTFQSMMNMGRSVRILGETLEESGIAFTYTDASLYLKENITTDQFIETYQDQYDENIKMQKRIDKYSEMLGEISDPQMAAIGPFIIVVLIIGCMNLVCIIYLQNVANRKKHAIYKSIGYSTSHLIKMNTWYVGMIAVVSMLVAIPVFVVVFPQVMTLSMSMFGFKKYPVFYNVTDMIIGNAVLLGLFLVSVLLTSKSLRGSQLKELAQE